MHDVEVNIKPSEKYWRVTEGYADPEGDSTNEAEWNDWPEEHKEAADAYIELVDQAATQPPVETSVTDGDLRISCPNCDRSWTTEPRSDSEAHRKRAEQDLRDRLQSHQPCDEGESLSWDDISVASDPDLVGKIATYFEGMDPTEPTQRLRAKLRLLDVEIYANAQMAARQELRN